MLSHQPKTPLVYVLDDDPNVLESLALLLRTGGYDCQTFRLESELLVAIGKNAPDALIIDVILTERSGVEVLRNLPGAVSGIPAFMVSGAADVATAVEAMKLGAKDFLQKPFAGHQLLEKLDEVFSGKIADQYSPFAQLTVREKHVLTEISAGASNKDAARKLGISPRTVEVHRAHVMKKLGAKSTADLLRLVFMKVDRSRRTGFG